MRFLLDESADRRLRPYLADLGHDVTRIGTEHPPSLDDEIVLAIAHGEGRILIASDRDFGDLIFVKLRPHRGVIYMRLEETSLDVKVARLLHVLAHHANDLHRYLVVTEAKVRVR